MKRREWLRAVGLGAVALALTGCAGRRRSAAAATVVVVGGGYGGATAAKYVRVLSDHTIKVVLIEPNPRFVSSPLSNLVLGGELELSDITRSYDQLQRRHGIRMVRERCSGVDPVARTVQLEHGATIRFDRLVLAPGIDAMSGAVDGLAEAQRAGRVLAGWSAGSETAALRTQLAAMRNGGVFAITVPPTPYRCPPAPYERASLVADYLQKHKPRSKVLVLDANQDVVAMGGLFKRVWRERYGGVLEYRNHHDAVAVDGATRTVRFDVQPDVRADVLNVMPPVRAGAVAVAAGLANIDARWCAVDFLSFESSVAPGVHIVGDSIHAGPMMPKTGHLANAHAKVAAAAIVAAVLEQPPNPQPVLSNTCFSFVSADQVIHSSTVYAFDPAARLFRPVAGAGGTSAVPSAAEVKDVRAWADNIWVDMLT